MQVALPALVSAMQPTLRIKNNPPRKKTAGRASVVVVVVWIGLCLAHCRQVKVPPPLPLPQQIVGGHSNTHRASLITHDGCLLQANRKRWA